MSAKRSAGNDGSDSAERLEAILQSAVVGIITIDESGRIESANPATERLFGYRVTELIGRNVSMLMQESDRERHASDLKNYLQTGDAGIIGSGRQVTCQRRDGTHFPAELTVSESRVRERRFFTGILRDVSERVRAEAAAAVRHRQQDSLVDLARRAITGENFDRLVQEAVNMVLQVLGVEFAKMLELTPAGDELILRAGAGWREGCVGMRRETAGCKSQAGYALLNNALVVTEDMASEQRFRPAELLAEHGVVSGMSAIIRGKVRPFGILGAHSSEKRGFTPDDIHFLQSIADVLAEVIERRQLEEEVLASTGREQRRIAQDLHDGLCQHLIGIQLRVEALVHDLHEIQHPREEAEKIGALMREGIRQARRLARSLMPVEVEQSGLVAALAELAKSSALLYRIECVFTGENTVLVRDAKVATHLYRIAQEAVSNAVRHARAGKIAITLRARGDKAILSVRNDGNSLPAEPGREGGMGLQIMNYRADMIGATLHLGSTASGETELTCTFDRH
jgi:PAS domain S-box-containing protein